MDRKNSCSQSRGCRRPAAAATKASLRVDLNQLDVEDERALGLAGRSFIGEPRRNPEAALLSLDHHLHSFRPAGDDVVQAEGRGLAARDAAVEGLSVGRPSGVMDGHGGIGARMPAAFARHNHLAREVRRCTHRVGRGRGHIGRRRNLRHVSGRWHARAGRERKERRARENTDDGRKKAHIIGTLHMRSLSVQRVISVALAAAVIAVTGVAADQQPSSNPYGSTYQPPVTRATVIRNATILTAAGPAIERGSVLLQKGKVAAVGETVTAPADALVIDASGKWVTPGVIDTHSHLGVYAALFFDTQKTAYEMTSPNTAEVSSEHAIWPQDPQFDLALAGGVTTMHILPGSANLFGGRSVTVKNVPARTADAMKFPGAPYGLKIACGENPARVYGSRNLSPSTRMGNVAGYRKAWQAASEYRDRWRKWKADGADPAKRPDRNLQLETLMGVLDGEIRIQNHCYRADEMATMIDISKEFGFKIASFHHAVEAYKIRDLLVANDICASMWADWWGFKLEAYDGIMQNIALVHEAGGCAIVHSDSADGIQRLNQEAAKAIRAGADAGITIARADAVKWLSINPAKALGIDKVTGSLEPGKNADVVIWSGDPFSAYAHAERVFIDGAQVFDRADTGRGPRSDFQLGILGVPGPSVPGPSVPGSSVPGSSIPAFSAPASSVSSSSVPTARRAAPAVRVPAPAPRVMPTGGDVVAITNARILPVSGPTIDRGTVVIRGGRIAAVGANLTAPSGARVIDAGGKIVTPGWLDSGVHTGIVEIPGSAKGTADQNTSDARVSAAFTVVDAFNGNSTVIPVTRVEGITRALVTPGGTGNVFLVQGAVMDLSGAQVPARRTRAPAVMVGLPGEAGAGVAGGSRSTAMLRLREVLDDTGDCGG